MKDQVGTTNVVTELDVLSSVDATRAMRGVLGNSADGFTVLPHSFSPICIPPLPVATGGNV
ncbi:hypothetical protein PHO31112_04174 [Pandoraea horticolens]|uniref:Uncharacterized protein n=1 Tax=Pandoraea horticolens TaxID=2508298 RepID=A0A5E4XYQ4_9BURK|nr:hypothetical protein [Pandoraea horticolens]VVE41496.1 hypothetical protein PHO31112_04174 [Pandoraea horticolens]